MHLTQCPLITPFLYKSYIYGSKRNISNVIFLLKRVKWVNQESEAYYKPTRFKEVYSKLRLFKIPDGFL